MSEKITRRELVKGAGAALLAAGIPAAIDTAMEVSQDRGYVVVVRADDGHELPEDEGELDAIAEEVKKAFRMVGVTSVACAFSDGLEIGMVVEVDEAGNITKVNGRG